MTLDYTELNSQLQKLEIQASLAELHGMTSGLAASHPLSIPENRWQSLVLEEGIELSGATDERIVFRRCEASYLVNVRILFGSSCAVELWQHRFATGLLYAHVPVDAFGLERRGEPVVAALRARGQRCSIMPLCTFVSFSGILKC